MWTVCRGEGSKFTLVRQNSWSCSANFAGTAGGGHAAWLLAGPASFLYKSLISVHAQYQFCTKGVCGSQQLISVKNAGAFVCKVTSYIGPAAAGPGK